MMRRNLIIGVATSIAFLAAPLPASAATFTVAPSNILAGDASTLDFAVTLGAAPPGSTTGWTSLSVTLFSGFGTFETHVSNDTALTQHFISVFTFPNSGTFSAGYTAVLSYFVDTPQFTEIPGGIRTEIRRDSFTLQLQGSELITVNASVSAVPLPAALPLLASGLGGIGVMGWWRRRKRAVAHSRKGVPMFRKLIFVCAVGIWSLTPTFGHAAVVGELSAVPNVLIAGQSTTLTLTLLLSSTPGFSNPQFVSGEAQIDFGDGQTPHSFFDFAGGVFREFNVSHMYTSPGGYNVGFSGSGKFAQTDGQAFYILDWVLPQQSIGVLVNPAPVPLPAALPLFAGGLGFLGWVARHRRKSEQYA